MIFIRWLRVKLSTNLLNVEGAQRTVGAWAYFTRVLVVWPTKIENWFKNMWSQWYEKHLNEELDYYVVPSQLHWLLHLHWCIVSWARRHGGGSMKASSSSSLSWRSLPVLGPAWDWCTLLVGGMFLVFTILASHWTCGWGRADGCGCRASSAGGHPAPVMELTPMDQIPCDVSTENDFSLPCICWGGLISFRKGSKQLLGPETGMHG